MALALNVFRTVTKVATDTEVSVYTAPVGYSGVILLAQATNIDTQNTYEITFSHRRIISNSPVITEIVKDYPIPSSEASNLLFGKLILETNDSLILSSNDPSGNIKLILSILETLN